VSHIKLELLVANLHEIQLLAIISYGVPYGWFSS